MPDFAGLSLWLNIAIFAGAAVCVWFAGVRITGYAEAISGKTGIGHAVVGMLLLAGVTSLPEIGVTVTASIGGESALAVNNLFGSIPLQAAILAVVDFAIGRRALTAVVPNPQVMLQGTLNILLLSFAAAGMTVGDFAFLGAGLWAWGCLILYVASVWVLSREEGRRPWLAARSGTVDRRLALIYGRSLTRVDVRFATRDRDHAAHLQCPHCGAEVLFWDDLRPRGGIWQFRPPAPEVARGPASRRFPTC